jgi:sterol desaturase/sphingolipid hydroxylase (fatty acid hydroxylase superfamily)
MFSTSQVVSKPGRGVWRSLPMNAKDYLPTVAAACILILLFAMESWLPAVAGRHRRLRHAARNLALGLLNAAALAVLAAPFIAQVAAWVEESRFGLLNLLNLPPVIAIATALLLFDVWMYLWHRANHEIGFLWRFHRVHHSDPEMDATTAVRFHTGEILISSALRLGVIPLLGITIYQLLVYEMLLLPVILFHHSNVRLSERLDRWLRLIIVTPAIHRIHHSRLRADTDSNYSSIFSFWDRMAGTFRLRRDGRTVNFGLDEFDGEEWQRLSGMMVMPFPPARRGSAVGVKNI